MGETVKVGKYDEAALDQKFIDITNAKQTAVFLNTPTAPQASDGITYNIKILDDGTHTYICVKSPRGWVKTVALT